MSKEFAGVAWCSRFPTSTSIDDLASPFRENIHRLHDAITAEDQGISIHVSATRRPAERAYLMHWSFLIATGHVPANTVPTFGDTVPIDWTCGNDSVLAIQSAKSMSATYDIKYLPSLTSNHIRGLAIDWTITFPDKAVAIEGADGKHYIISGTPRNQTNKHFLDVAATYGVYHKVIGDDPHFSSTGH